MKRKFVALAICTALLLSGCATGEKGSSAVSPSAEIAEEDPRGDPLLEIEAESGVFSGNCNVKSSKKYSGEAYVTGFQGSGDSTELEFVLDESVFCDLVFLMSSMDGSHKENYVFLDGTQLGTVKTDGSSISECTLKRVYLEEGTHTISLNSYWGYVNWDKLELYESPELPEDMYEVGKVLVNPNADENAQKLMDYLTGIYGDYILSGQYGEGGYESNEVKQIAEVNGGKLPAVIGLEMGDCCQTAVDNNFTHPSVEDAIDTWERGGIVTMCYHWLAPEQYITGIWWEGFRNDKVSIPLKAIMNGEDEEGMELLLKDIDILAGELQQLEDAGVPILWRPLHEAAGGWFWWGNYGADTYKKLYVLMYEKLTEEYGLDNLIWVWNGQDEDWYPGDEYVDIIAVDLYPGEQQYSSHVDSFLELYDWLGEENKMIVLSENGTMPDIDACVRDGAMWGFFCTWNGEFVLTTEGETKYSEKYTEKDMLTKIYNHDKVLTLDELPDIKK